MRTLALAVLALLLSASCLPQPADPRTSSSTRADTSAPPRLPSGRPDFSGVWMLKATVDPGLAGLPFGPEMFNIGASLEGGLPYQPWAAATVAAHRADGRRNDPLTHCLPIGFVRAHTITFYRQLIQLPDQLLFLSEYNSEFRRFYTDGRPAPTDVEPKVNGYSVGHWAGDVLVVETSGFRDGALSLDAFGSPLTDAAKITERFRRTSYHTMAIELTVDDPKAYSRPWTVTLNQELVEDADLDEAFCAEQQLVDLVSNNRK